MLLTSITLGTCSAQIIATLQTMPVDTWIPIGACSDLLGLPANRVLAGVHNAIRNHALIKRMGDSGWEFRLSPSTTIAPSRDGKRLEVWADAEDDDSDPEVAAWLNARPVLRSAADAPPVHTTAPVSVFAMAERYQEACHG